MGDTVGHYRILEAIGAGGMGEVYRAHDERLDRDVALKLLPASSLGDATARARLTREARSAAALNHPHICSVYDVGEEGDQAYIAMELVEGRSLAAVLADRPLPAGRASRYGTQVAEALAHAHERGIVHRDLKSSNVMVTADDRVKVLDFGLARRMAAGAPASNAVTESRPTTLTQPGTLVGTLAYMAPEQLKGARGDARSDIWALGVMLYEMVVGVRPFRGTSGFELAAAVLNEPVPPLPAGAEPRLKAVIARCLAKNPDQRFQGAAEIRAALESGARPARRLGVALPALALAVAVGVGVALFGPHPFSGSRAPRVRALAVLPLENLSGDSSQEYLADGMTEALIAELGRLRGDTKVIGRASVMRYKASKSPPGEIARELNVDALLTGALVRSGDHVRLTAALVDPESGENLWAGRYERDLRDVLVMQSDLTQAVLVELRGALGPEATQLLAAARRVDPAAYEDYLKGRFYWYRMTPQDLDTARVYFERALTKDPDYAVAYIGLADAIATPAHAGLMPTTDVFPRARNLVARALALDPALPEAHDMEARFLFAWDWDWPAAEREFRRALELNPSYPDAHCIYAQLLQSADRLEQSIGEARRAVEIDPQNPFFQLQLAVSLAGAGRTEDAIAEGRGMLAADPGSYLAHDLMWDLYFLKGRHADALREAQASFAALGRQDVADAMAHGAKGGYPAAMAEAAHALAAGRQRAASSYVGAITIARAWAHAGQNERVLEWLQRAAAERDTRMCYVVGDPLYAGIRRDSRFREVVARAQALAQAAASTARAASASS